MLWPGAYVLVPSLHDTNAYGFVPSLPVSPVAAATVKLVP